MGSDRLVADLERQADRAVLLRVGGRLMETTVPLLAGVLHALRRSGTVVTVDLSGVEQIDSRGLELLLGTDAEIHGVRESLRRAPPDAPQYSR